MSTKPAGRRAAPRSAPTPATRAKKPADKGLSDEDRAELEASVFGAPSASLPAVAPAAPPPRSIPVALLRPSPSNPRRQVGDLTELVASLKGTGQLQPILVRPHPQEAEAYEIVCGHRRAAAAPLAGLTELLVVVRALTDREVLEAQIAENSQRADVHPMEEAAALHRLHLKHRVDVDELAARLGRSPFYIHQRLRLMKLAPEAIVAFERGRLSLSVSLSLARLPETSQLHALPSLLVDEGQPPRQLAECRAALDRLTLRLLDSPFELDDASLPGGACTRCPKRSGNQIALFTEAEGPDICTDPVCYQGKVSALAERAPPPWVTPPPPSAGPASPGSRGKNRPGKGGASHPASAPYARTPHPATTQRPASPPRSGADPDANPLADSLGALGEQLAENGFDLRVFRLVAEAFLAARLDPARRDELQAASNEQIWGLWAEESLRAAGPEEDDTREAIERRLANLAN